jgi:hypothetical protein
MVRVLARGLGGGTIARLFFQRRSAMETGNERTTEVLRKETKVDF